jgi:hypothetical protein
MAWIAPIRPSPRHPHERYQVRYQDGKHQRSAGIFPTERRALAEKRAIDRGDRVRGSASSRGGRGDRGGLCPVQPVSRCRMVGRVG